MRSVLILGALCTMLHSAFSQSQYASSVITFSTEWSTTNWSAQQTLGAPNTTGCGDIATAWASASMDGQREFLVLGFTTPQYVNTVNIFETWNPGAVDTIYLRNSGNGSWNIVYTSTATPALPCPRTFTTTFPTTSYLVDAIRIASNSPAVPSWNEIDAVEITLNCSLSVNSINVLCNGMCTGSAGASSSGPGPYTYLWTPGNFTTSTITGLCAGTYSVSVTDANACTAVGSVTITEPPILAVSISSATPQVCFNSCNGSLTANPSGGTSGYTYQWDPGGQTSQTATGYCAGTYTVTVTDQNGCTATASSTITSFPAVVISTIQTTPVLCNGDCNGTATVSSSGGCGGPYMYVWIPGNNTGASQTGMCAGTYTVVVTDACGCTAVTSLTILQPFPLILPPSSSTPETCPGCCDGTLTGGIPTGGNTPYSYLWSPMNYTTLNVSGVCPGIYTLCVTDANGCTACNTVTVTPSTVSIIEENSDQFLIFPQPASNNLTVLFADPVKDLPVMLYSITGEMMLQDRVTGKQKDWDVSGLSPGIYTLQVIIGEQTFHRRIQIMKQP